MAKRKPFHELTPYGRRRENIYNPCCHYCGEPLPDVRRAKIMKWCSSSCGVKGRALEKDNKAVCYAHMLQRKIKHNNRASNPYWRA